MTQASLTGTGDWTYRQFRARFLDSVAAFQLDGDEEHLRQLGSVLPPPEELAEYQPSAGYVQVIQGWVYPWVIPSSMATRWANRHLHVRVRRYPRPDLGFAGRLLLSGYRIEVWPKAGAPDDSPLRVEPKFLDLRGRSREPRIANVVVEQSLGRLRPADRTPALGGRVGFIDDVRTRIRRAGAGGLRQRRPHWTAQLLAECPEVLWHFATHEAGEPWREQFVRFLDATPGREEWADRYRLLAYGLTEPFRSALVPLVIERPRPDLVPSSGSGLPRPEPRQAGAVIAFDPGAALLPSPDTSWLTVEDAEVQDGGTVTSNGHLVMYESAADPVHRFVSGTWHASYGAPARPEAMLFRRAVAAPEGIEEGVLLAGRNDLNWYHWLAEYLPRVLTIPDAIPADVPLLVTSRTPGTGLEALRELTDRRLEFIDPQASQRVKRLHVAAPVTQVVDDRIDALPTLDLPALRLLRARWQVDEPRTEPGRRIFLSRRSEHRRVVNQAALEAVAREEGLELVDPGGLTFAAQRQLYSSADLVAGAGGAVMANYLLVRPGSAIVAFTSEQLGAFLLPAALAAVAGSSFRYVTGPSRVERARARDINAWIHADYVVSPEVFRATLRELG